MKKSLLLIGLAVCSLWFLASPGNGFASLRLPPLSDDLPDRLRGATLLKLPVWSDPTILQWKYIDDFPKWGGNVFSLMLEPFRDGMPILPGRPLTERLAKALERYTTVIDWALQNNMYFIVRFQPSSTFPPPARDWPDDGRSLWKSASAQDELVQAWVDMAKLFKGKKGVIFNPVTEPHGITPDEIAGKHALPKKVWNSLYPRLIDAIRAEDPSRWIAVEPIWGDPSNFADLAVSSAPKLIFECHFYNPHYFTHQGLAGNPPAQTVVYPGLTRETFGEPEIYWDKSVLEQRLLPAINFRSAHNVRVFVGEFGSVFYAPDASRARWTADVIDLLEAHGFDWAYFQYEALRDGHVGWTFEAASFESTVTSKLSLNLIAVNPVADFDGDGKSDIAVYRNGLWIYSPSSGGANVAVQFGGGTDVPVPADYDGDGKTDIAVYRNGLWIYSPSSGGASVAVQFGGGTDVPVPADYDGDGKTDVAVYRSGLWIYQPSSGGANVAVQFGGGTDVPVQADYDGDGKTDIAVYRNGLWIYQPSSGGANIAVQFGGGTDVPVPADYDGDGKTDISVYRNGLWIYSPSSGGANVAVQFGGGTDIPMPADYDGDGETDIAVYRSGLWIYQPSSGGANIATQFGGGTDVPLN